MLNGTAIVGFVPTTDFDRARPFYSGMLGLALESEDDFALVYRSGSTTVRVVKVEAFAPQPFTVLGWQVGDVDGEAARLRQRGVLFERYPFVQHEHGIWTSPSGQRVAWFKDPDGNVLSISG